MYSWRSVFVEGMSQESKNSAEALRLAGGRDLLKGGVSQPGLGPEA